MITIPIVDILIFEIFMIYFTQLIIVDVLIFEIFMIYYDLVIIVQKRCMILSSIGLLLSGSAYIFSANLRGQRDGRNE